MEKRDEGEQLDMGSPGKTSTRQKPMAHSDRGLMCFETRRGLSKLSKFEVQVQGFPYSFSCGTTLDSFHLRLRV